MKGTRVLAVANQKGGVAKTTTVASLGAAFADAGKRVLLIDLDPQGCLTFSLGQDPDKLPVSVHEVLLGDVEPSAALVETTEGMTLLPANIDLAGAEAMLLMRAGREYALKRALDKLDGTFDVVVIDCPPSLGVLTLNGLTAADEVIVPLQCETLAHRGVGQFLRTVNDVQQITNPKPETAGCAADAVRPTNHAHPRRATRRRGPLRPAGAGATHSANGALRRGQRVGLVGVGRTQEQGRVRLPGVGPGAAQALEVGQGSADVRDRGLTQRDERAAALLEQL